MKLEIAFMPSAEIDYSKKSAVVIDILRASSTMVSAFARDCAAVIPAASLDEARQIKGKQPQMVLCGERKGLKPEGFELGNSPAEYTSEAVSGAELVLTTSNGTRAIVRAGAAAHILIGSFLNLRAVVDKALQFNKDIVLVCAGNEGDFSYEDTFCATMMAWKLIRINSNITLADSARWALSHGPDTGRADEAKILAMLRKTSHGQKLQQLGFSRDLKLCAQINSSGIVPYMDKGKLII